MNFPSLLLYNIALRFYHLGIILASPYNNKAKQWLEGRRNWQQQLKGLPAKKGKRVWFHCASLGEFEQARPVIEKWSCDHPDDLILLTFFSPSGYEIRKQYECADLVMYLPLDTAGNAKEFIELLQPDIALFVKYEFWYHYLNELKRKNIPVILFSSVFRSGQIFFKWYGSLYRDMLRLFGTIYVQSEASKELLQSISILAEVNPDTRFDRVHQIAESVKEWPVLEKFKAGSKIIVAGSTWRADEEVLLTIMSSGDPAFTQCKYIIAPHNVTAQNIAYLQQHIVLPSQLLSQLTEANAADTKVIIVDSVGQLSSLYSYGDIAYIGGGFNTSVHNVLEAAVYGMPVIFGPNYHKSLEAIDLLGLTAAFTFTDKTTLQLILRGLLEDTNGVRSAAVINSKNYVLSHLGGAYKICDKIESYLH